MINATKSKNNFDKFPFNLNQFSVVYQPIFDINTGKLIKLETLVRWVYSQDVEGFVSHFENTPDKIKDITKFVVERVCGDLMRIKSIWKNPIVAINFAPVTLSDPIFVIQVLKILELYQIPHHWVEFELTESPRGCSTALLDCINILANEKIAVSLDDFGTGASSLSCVKNLPIKTIKVDKSFISGIGKCKASEAVIMAIDKLCVDLKLICVAEGIESVNQLRFISQSDISQVQGFLLSKPINIEMLLVFIHCYDEIPQKDIFLLQDSHDLIASA
jgi:EAL domain-containing protein (putative c-di-GMP-specific phosphodiesterase class I)